VNTWRPTANDDSQQFIIRRRQVALQTRIEQFVGSKLWLSLKASEVKIGLKDFDRLGVSI
jgi:hypothetical protein